MEANGRLARHCRGPLHVEPIASYQRKVQPANLAASAQAPGIPAAMRAFRHAGGLPGGATSNYFPFFRKYFIGIIPPTT
jgi:hypothetical protein